MIHRLTYAGIILLVMSSVLSFTSLGQQEKKSNPLTVEMVGQAQKIMGLSFSEAQRDSMLENLAEQLESFEKLRMFPLPNSVPPAILFNPIPVGFEFEKARRPFKKSSPSPVKLPKTLDDLAFYSVGQLSELIRTRKVTSEQLTTMYLARLKKYGPRLECVITLTEELALKQAKRADREIARGKYRGPLHGIPYGAKDLLAVKEYKTTWGSVPYKEQVIDEDATVIKRLFCRLGLSNGCRPCRICDWNGNAWLHCLSVNQMWSDRAPPVIRTGEQNGSHGSELVDGQDRSDLPHR
jgi:hypothetical protein